MPFDLKEIKGSIQSDGYLKTHSFTVMFGTPKVMQGKRFSIVNSDSGKAVNSASLSEIPKLMVLRADTAQIPGSLLLTTDSARYGIGPNQKTPVNVIFTDTAFTFIADSYGLLWAYFYFWHNSIFSWDQKASGGRVPSYTMEYRENFSTDIIINVYEPHGRKVMSFKLIDAYPTLIPSTPLSWGENDQILKMNVGFTFRQWEMMDFATENGAGAPTTTDTWAAGAKLSINSRPGSFFSVTATR